MIRYMGGPAKFYQQFFLSAVCPLGFTREGLNLNYYDDRKLERAVTPFIVSSVERHIAFGCRRDHVVILGRGDNARFFGRLNDEYRWFGEVHALDHPRFIMQYRRKRLDDYGKSKSKTNSLPFLAVHLNWERNLWQLISTHLFDRALGQ